MQHPNPDPKTFIVKIKQDSPADLAGLQPGDVIIAINGERLRSSAEMHNRLGLLQAGQVIRIEAIRDRATLVVEATMVERQRDLVDSQSLHPRLAASIPVASIISGPVQ